MSDPRPILFFDSGVGGLSIAGPARMALPTAPFVYVADSAGFPYGEKSEAEIAGRVPALLGRLAERYRPRLIVIACNTASTIALPAVRAALDLPVVGTVPAIKPAALNWSSSSRPCRSALVSSAAPVMQPKLAYRDCASSSSSGSGKCSAWPSKSRPSPKRPAPWLSACSSRWLNCPTPCPRSVMSCGKPA